MPDWLLIAVSLSAATIGFLVAYHFSRSANYQMLRFAWKKIFTQQRQVLEQEHANIHLGADVPTKSSHRSPSVVVFNVLLALILAALIFAYGFSQGARYYWSSRP